MHEFKMPSLGADMDAGTLVKWLIDPGDKVKRGDVIAVVNTDKAAVEMEIWENGTLDKILVKPGEKVPVGTPLALIREETTPETKAPTVAAAPVVTQPPAQPTQESTPPTPSAPSIAPAPPPKTPGLATTGETRAKASPAAKRRAQELGVDLAHVKGTGAEEAITQSDVEKAAGAPPETPSPIGAMRRAIAASMARSKREIPHYYLATEIDMRAALEWLSKENLTRPVAERLVYAALLIKATARAVKDVPEMNGFWINEAFQKSDSVHPGIAISLRQGGLIAPALHDADKKNLAKIMADLRDLAQRVRAGSLRSSELSDSTITITNLGEQGVDMAFGVIYPPQVAMVSFGRINSRGTLTATLSGDHRTSDGHRGGIFLSAINRLLQEPARL